MSANYYKTSDTVTPFITIQPLESNGTGNLSTPRQVVDIEFLDKTFLTPTDAFIVNDDVTTRFVTGFVFTVLGGIYDGTYTVVAPGAVSIGGKTHIPVADIVSTATPYNFDVGYPIVVTATTPGNYLVTWVVDGLPTVAVNDQIQVKHIAYNDNVTNGVVDRNYFVYGVTAGAPSVGLTTIVTVLQDEHPNSAFPIIGVDADSTFVTGVPQSVAFGYAQYTVSPASTSLMLTGKGAPLFNNTTTWGNALQSNMLHMLENFADITAPTAPIDGQLWFDTTAGPTAGPVLNLYSGAVWYGVVAEGLPVQGNINMNDFKIANVTNATTTYPYVASSTGWGNNDQEAMNLGTSDALYIAKTGGYDADPLVRSGTMTGSLNLTGAAGINFKAAGSGNLTFEATSTGGIVVEGTGSVTVATGDVVATTGNIVATAGNVRVGSGTNQVVTQNNAGLAPTITFTTATTANNVIDLGTNMITGLSAPILSSDATNKAYVDSYVSGIIWLRPVLDPSLFDDSLSAPPVDDGFTEYHRTYIVAGTGSGSWTGFDGHLMAYDGATWQSVLGRAVQVGDRFGVFCSPDNDDPLSTLPGGGLLNQAGKIAEVLTVSPYTYTLSTPAEPDAFSVIGIAGSAPYQSPHMGHSYTFRGQYGVGSYGSGYSWIVFSGPQMVVDGAGLRYDANVLNTDGNLLSLYNLSTNGIVAHTAANTVTSRTITGTTSNIVVTNGDGVSANPTIDLAPVTQGAVGTSLVKVAIDGFGRVTDNVAVVAADITGLGILPYDDTLAAIAALPVGSTGVVIEVGDDAFVERDLQGTAGRIVITNADGVSGDPTWDLAAVAQGAVGTSFVKVAIDGFGRVTDNVAVVAADITTLVDGTYLNVTGDSLTAGDLTLFQDPTSAMHATTKQYVDVARVKSTSATLLGVPGASAKVLLHITSQAFTIPATPTGTPCYGYADIAATAITDFDIQKNGVSVGTMSFAATANTATFTFASPVSMVAGDRLAVIAPATPDATLADVYLTIHGILN